MDAKKAAEPEDPTEVARKITVEVVLEMKSAYIRAGANPLKHMTQIQDRMRAAARTTTSVREWTTEMVRRLNIGAPGRSLCSAMDELHSHVGETIGQAAWLDLVEREFGFLIAMTKLEHEQKGA